MGHSAQLVGELSCEPRCCGVRVFVAARARQLREGEERGDLGDFDWCTQQRVLLTSPCDNLAEQENVLLDATMLM